LSLKVLNQILSAEYDVHTAQSGREALELAVSEKPDLILLDILMPDMSGFDVLVRLKDSAETQKVPVIFITANTSPRDEERGLTLGAADYITKPFQDFLIRARVRTQINNVKQRKEIELLSMTDDLTDIPNRRSFELRLEMEWTHAIREQAPIALLMIDLDNFKMYNDTYGHPQGDVLLKTVAATLVASTKRAADVAARIGGEEFVILLPSTDYAGALEIAENLRAAVAATVVATSGGGLTSATISIGVVCMRPNPGDAAVSFVEEADARLYRAKRAGRNRVCGDDCEPVDR
jgi:diguanylate cyclase (GGDEF)-like protein